MRNYPVNQNQSRSNWPPSYATVLQSSWQTLPNKQGNISMSRVLVGILLVAVVIILLRTMYKATSGLWGSAVEGFWAAPRAINTTTACPAGAKLYMYEGTAYCCDGRINTDATTLAGTCRPGSSAPDAKPTFCTLGAGTATVPNCLSIRSGLLAAEAEATCPPRMPNYAMGPAGSATAKGRCCSGPLNHDSTDCMHPNPGSFCDVAGVKNEFAGGQHSCEFLRAQELDRVKCPTGMGPFVSPGHGNFDGITLFGCTDNHQNCYSKAVIDRLGELGFSTTGMTECKAV
jgi:hypothetical protein